MATDPRIVAIADQLVKEVLKNGSCLMRFTLDEDNNLIAEIVPNKPKFNYDPWDFDS